MNWSAGGFCCYASKFYPKTISELRMLIGSKNSLLWHSYNANDLQNWLETQQFERYIVWSGHKVLFWSQETRSDFCVSKWWPAKIYECHKIKFLESTDMQRSKVQTFDLDKTASSATKSVSSIWSTYNLKSARKFNKQKNIQVRSFVRSIKVCTKVLQYSII